jgi:hypothetical protein
MSFNPYNHSATIFDSGDQPYEATNVAQVARAVTPTLVHANETANQYIYINSFTLTQNKVLIALEKASGKKWEVTHAKVKDFGESRLKRGQESISQNPVRLSAVGDSPDGAPELIFSVIYGYRPDGLVSLNDFQGKAKLWNKKLGLKGEDLDETVSAVLGKVKAAKAGTTA